MQEQVVESRRATKSLFNFEQLKQIGSELNFDSPTRMSRDGTKEIHVHARVYPSEILKFLIFDLANCITINSDLELKMRKEVLEYYATLLFYGHGHKKVKG